MQINDASSLGDYANGLLLEMIDQMLIKPLFRVLGMGTSMKTLRRRVLTKCLSGMNEERKILDGGDAECFSRKQVETVFSAMSINIPLSRMVARKPWSKI